MLGIRPGDLQIGDDGLPAVVERIEDLGDSRIVSFTAAGQLLKLKSDRVPMLAEGQAVRRDSRRPPHTCSIRPAACACKRQRKT